MAVLLSWALFALWGTIGLALLKLGRFRWTVTTLLFSPTVGFVALTVPTYIMVRFGVPVRLSAVPVVAVLILLSLAVLWRARPTAQRARRLWRRSRAFAAVLVAAFGLAGWPLVGYGFDWVAQGNDDMANYCLIAAGYRDHGYVHVPTPDEVLAGHDRSQAFFFFALWDVRPGSELLLALGSAWTGYATQQVFMPTHLALNLALIASAAGLAIGGTGRRAAGLLTAALLAVSGASAYGVVHQLIGQASGLAVICTALALVSGRFRRLPGGTLARRAAVCGLVFCGQIVFYPEITPLLVGACVALGVRDIVRRRLDRRHLAHAAGAIGVMVALVPAYLCGCAWFLWQQAEHGSKVDQAVKEIFPHYLTPRGPAMVCGVLPTAGPESALAQNVYIVLGMVVLVAVGVLMLAGVLRGRPFAAVLAVATALGASMYAQGAAFGVFKIAMFVQPFLWAVVAAWVVGRRARWSVATAAVALVALAALNARVQFWYVDQSRGQENRVDLPALTARHALSRFRAEYARAAAEAPVDQVLLASQNVVLLKLLATEVRGVPTSCLGIDPFTPSSENREKVPQRIARLQFQADWREPVRALFTSYDTASDRTGPTVREPATGAPLHTVLSPIPDRTTRPPERVLLIGGGGPVTVLNRHRYPESGPVIVLERLADVRNFAAFCDATGARQNFLGMRDAEKISFSVLESDVAFRKRTMVSVGPAMVLNVLNPSPRVRVLVDSTGSCRVDPLARVVPPTQVVGDRRVALGAVGRGSARLVSPPLATQAVGHERFLVLDFGPGSRYPNRLSAADRLWAANLPRDRRFTSAHVRDISVLSEEEYAAFRPPQQIASFPNDLTHPHLEYSGLYEEGWFGKEFKVRLSQPGPGHEAVIRGSIPQLGSATGFRTEVTVLVDGAPVEKRALAIGDFEVRAPGGATAGPRWVELRFSHDQVLPAPDGRPLVALLKSAGFEPTDESKSRPPEKLAAFPVDMSHPKLVYSGMSVDGWCGQSWAATLWQVGPGRDAVVRGQIPLVDGNTGHLTDVTLLIDGVEVATRRLGPGDFELRVPGGKTAQARKLECRFSNTQALPPPDGRAVGAHLRFVGFEPTAPAP